MAEQVRPFPGTSEQQNWRALEAFFSSVERLLRFVGTTTTTVGSISADAIAMVAVSVPGVRANEGQTVQVGLPASINPNLIPWGNVTADDIVTIYLYNSTGSAIVLPEYTLSVRVMP